MRPDSFRDFSCLRDRLPRPADFFLFFGGLSSSLSRRAWTSPGGSPVRREHALSGGFPLCREYTLSGDSSSVKNARWRTRSAGNMRCPVHSQNGDTAQSAVSPSWSFDPRPRRTGSPEASPEPFHLPAPHSAAFRSSVSFATFCAASSRLFPFTPI